MMAIPEGAWNNPPEPEPVRECGTCALWDPCPGCGEEGVCLAWREYQWRGEHEVCDKWEKA